MKLKTKCPHCEKSLSIRTDLIGRRVKCPGCQTPFEVADVRTPTSQASIDTAAEALANETAGAPERLIGKEENPTSIGRFQLRKKLGEGGFGSVFQAYDPVLDRETALKVPHKTANVQQQQDRSLKEAKAAARLRHPNIVGVFEVGVADQRPFIASEFIQSRALSDILKDASQKPSLEQQITWLVELCRGLAYAHREGIVHRDIKPHNVLIEEASNRAILTDFGLARRTFEKAEGDSANAIVGTLGYLSPEQAKGDQSQVGPASDQYGLGVVLYQMLAGRRPFKGNSYSLIPEIIAGDFPPPSEIGESVPRELEAICLKALSNEADNRYSDCDAMADDLQRWLDGELVEATDPTLLRRAIHWGRKRPQIAAWLITAASLLLVATGISITVAVQQTFAANRATETDAGNGVAASDVETDGGPTSTGAEPNQANGGFTEGAANAPHMLVAMKTDSSSYARTLKQVELEIEKNNLSKAHDLLDRVPWDQRHVEHGLLRRRALGTPFSRMHVDSNGVGVQSLAYSNDGRFLISTGHNGTVCVWKSDDLSLVKTHNYVDLKAAAFLKNSETLVTLQGVTGTLSGWKSDDLANWDSAKPAWTQKIEHLSGLQSLAVHPSRPLIAITSDKACPGFGNVEVRDLSDPKNPVVHRPQLGDAQIEHIAFLADGTKLAAMDVSGEQQFLIDLTPQSEVSVEVPVNVPAPRVVPPQHAVEDQPAPPAQDAPAPPAKEESAPRAEIFPRVSLPYLVAMKPTESAPAAQKTPEKKPEKPPTITIKHRPLIAEAADLSKVVLADGRQFFWEGQPLGKIANRNSGQPKTVLELPNQRGSFVVVRSAPIGAARLEISGAACDTEVLHGHNTAISCIALRPDGACFATADVLGEIRVWPCESRTHSGCQFVSQHDGKRNRLSSVACSFDNQFAANASPRNKSGVLDVWNPVTGELLFQLTGHQSGIHAVHFHPSQSLLATSDGSKRVRVWDLGSKSVLREWNVNIVPQVLEFSPNGDVLLIAAGRTQTGTPRSPRVADQPAPPAESAPAPPAGSGTKKTASPAVGAKSDGVKSANKKPADSVVELWNPATGQPLQTFSDHEGRVISATFTADGKHVVSGSSDGTLKEWSVADGTLIHDYSTDGRIPIQICIGQQVLAVLFAEPCSLNQTMSSYKNSVRVWDGYSHSLEYELPSTMQHFYSIDVSLDGRRLLTSSDELVIRNAATGSELLAFPGLMRKLQEQVPYTYTVTKTRQEQRSRTIAVAVPHQIEQQLSGSVRVRLDGTSDGWKLQNRSVVDDAKRAFISAKCVSRDSVQGITTGKSYVIETNEDGMTSVRESDNEEIIEATADVSVEFAAQSITVCRTKMEQREVTYTVCVPYLEQMTGTRTICKTVFEPRNFARFSPDSNRLLFANFGDSVKVLSAELPDAVKELTKPITGNVNQVAGIATSPDGTQVAIAVSAHRSNCHACGESEITVWDKQTGTILWSRKLKDESVAGIHFDPASGNLITTGAIGAVSENQTLEPVPDDGVAQAVAKSVNTAISIRSPDTGDLIERFGNGTQRILTSVIASKASIVATWDDDDTLSIWDTDEKALVRSVKLKSVDKRYRDQSIFKRQPMISLSPDGEILACSINAKQSLYAKTKSLSEAVYVPIRDGGRMPFSEDGQTLFALTPEFPSSQNVNGSGWSITEIQAVISAGNGKNAHPAESALEVDGRVFTNGQLLCLIDSKQLQSARPRILSRPHATRFNLNDSAWLPNRSQLAILDQKPNGPVLLWDLQSSVARNSHFVLSTQ